MFDCGEVFWPGSEPMSRSMAQPDHRRIRKSNEQTMARAEKRERECSNACWLLCEWKVGLRTPEVV